MTKKDQSQPEVSETSARGVYAWQSDKSAMDRNRHMYKTKVAADICFLVGSTEEEQKKIWAHKYLLISSSPVFEAMVDPAWQVQEEGKELKPVEISDIIPQAFEEMLRYIYYEDVKLKSCNTFSILYAAKKYQLPGLVDMCQDFLRSTITVSVVCQYLEESLKCGEEDIYLLCLDYIRTHANQVLGSNYMLTLSRQSLKMVVQDDDLEVENEKVVYDACMRWALHQVKGSSKAGTDWEKRKKLGCVFTHIRFAVMTKEDLYEILQKTSLFTKDEKLEIYESILFPRKGPLTFSFSPRNLSLIEINRFTGYNPGTFSTIPIYNHGISFQVDKKVRWVGLGMYKYSGPQFSGFTAEIFDSKNASIHKFGDGDMSTKMVKSGHISIWQWLFNESVTVEENQVYTISTRIEYYGLGSFSTWPSQGQNGQANVTCKGLNLTFSAPSHIPNNASTVQTGQIPQLLFKVLV